MSYDRLAFILNVCGFVASIDVAAVYQSRSRPLMFVCILLALMNGANVIRFGKKLWREK